MVAMVAFLDFHSERFQLSLLQVTPIPASILYKSIADRYRPVSYPDGPITDRYRFIKNAYWDTANEVNQPFGSGEKVQIKFLTAATQSAFYVNLYRAVIGPSG